MARARRGSLLSSDLKCQLGITLAEALREHGRDHEVSRTRQTRWGPRFEIDGELNTPDGRRPRIRTVWQLDQGKIAPRLITAYPLEAET